MIASGPAIPSAKRTNLDAVHFDLDLCEAILDGYLTVASGFLGLGSSLSTGLHPSDPRTWTAISDGPSRGDAFRTSRKDYNLHRAAVQFRLTASIEAQMDEIRALVQRLGADIGTR